MTKDQFEREMNYRVALALAKSMLRQGIINDADFNTIDTILAEKFRPVFGALCRENR